MNNYAHDRISSAGKPTPGLRELRRGYGFPISEATTWARQGFRISKPESYSGLDMRVRGDSVESGKFAEFNRVTEQLVIVRKPISSFITWGKYVFEFRSVQNNRIVEQPTEDLLSPLKTA